jgi:hypothetical protein
VDNAGWSLCCRVLLLTNPSTSPIHLVLLLSCFMPQSFHFSDRTVLYSILPSLSLPSPVTSSSSSLSQLDPLLLACPSLVQVTTFSPLNNSSSIPWPSLQPCSSIYSSHKRQIFLSLSLSLSLDIFTYFNNNTYTKLSPCNVCSG